MKKFIFGLMVFVVGFFSTQSIAGMKGKVGLVETRAEWGNVLIIVPVDDAGNRVKVCNVARDTQAMAIPLTEISAKYLASEAIAAKISGKAVVYTALDNSGGDFCKIANFAIDY